MNGVYAPIRGFGTISEGLLSVLKNRENVEFETGRNVEKVEPVEGGRVSVDGDVYDAVVMNVEAPVAKETGEMRRGVFAPLITSMRY